MCALEEMVYGLVSYDCKIWNLNRDVNQPLWGNSKTLRVEPMALAGRLVEKRARTAPVLP